MEEVDDSYSPFNLELMRESDNLIPYYKICCLKIKLRKVLKSDIIDF